MSRIIRVRECRAKLAELIKEHALRHGDFTLASGQKSSYFIDGKMVTLRADGSYYLARIILSMLDEEVQVVAGIPIGADPIVGAVTALAGMDGRPLTGCLVRKEQKDHGTRKQVEGQVPQGARVVILEDVVTTGGSSLIGVEALRKEKEARILGVITMVDRLQGAEANLATHGVKLHSIFTIADLGVNVG